jgi:hypothetical protein
MIKPIPDEYIPNDNFGVVILLDELWVQQTLFDRNYRWLIGAADHWVKLARSQDFDRVMAPIDIVGASTLCLSTMAVVRRMLLIKQKNNPKANRRREVLNALLGKPRLPVIESATVRNKWEHLDEELDGILPNVGVGDSSSTMHVSAKDLAPRTFALKRFDPRTLTLYSLDGDSIVLHEAAAEMELLRQRLEEAMKKLKHIIVKPWN